MFLFVRAFEYSLLLLFMFVHVSLLRALCQINMLLKMYPHQIKISQVKFLFICLLSVCFRIRRQTALRRHSPKTRGSQWFRQATLRHHSWQQSKGHCQKKTWQHRQERRSLRLYQEILRFHQQPQWSQWFCKAPSGFHQPRWIFRICKASSWFNQPRRSYRVCQASIGYYLQRRSKWILKASRFNWL